MQRREISSPVSTNSLCITQLPTELLYCKKGGGMDNMCTVYDVNNRDTTGSAKLVRELAGYEGFLSSCRFLDDNHILTGSGDMKLCVWDLETGKKTAEVAAAHGGDVVSISMSPDGNQFVTGSVDRTCKLWDVRELKQIQTFFGHSADVNR